MARKRVYTPQQKAARAVVRKRHYERNKAKVLAQVKAYYDANKSDVLAKQAERLAAPGMTKHETARKRQWRNANLPRVRATEHARYWRDPEAILAPRRERRAEKRGVVPIVTRAESSAKYKCAHPESRSSAVHPLEKASELSRAVAIMLAQEPQK